MWPYSDVTPANQSLDDTLVQCVGDFCRWVVGDDDFPIVRGWVNAVSRPAEPYVMITPYGTTWHATSTRSYSVDEEDETTGTATIGRSMSRRVQVDFYGPDAERQAHAAAILFQDYSGCSFFESYHLTPLTAASPQELTFANGEEQAEPRWMLELEIQPWADFASVQVELDFFSTVTFGRPRPL